MRDRLAAQPSERDFEQQFVPAGFSSGESEHGLLALDLPSRVRWDYVDPYPKSYLVVEGRAFAWNRGEGVGQSFTVGDDEAAHLDLLRLEVEQLRDRFDATVTADPDDSSRRIVSLIPTGDGRIRGAQMVLATDGRLTEIRYQDAEGNQTRFLLGAPRPLAPAGDSAARFAPPAGLEWEQH